MAQATCQRLVLQIHRSPTAAGSIGSSVGEGLRARHAHTSGGITTVPRSEFCYGLGTTIQGQRAHMADAGGLLAARTATRLARIRKESWHNRMTAVSGEYGAWSVRVLYTACSCSCSCSCCLCLVLFVVVVVIVLVLVYVYCVDGYMYMYILISCSYIQATIKIKAYTMPISIITHITRRHRQYLYTKYTTRIYITKTTHNVRPCATRCNTRMYVLCVINADAMCYVLSPYNAQRTKSKSKTNSKWNLLQT